MELGIETISKDKTVYNNRVKDLEEFNSQSTQVKKGEQLVSMLPAIKKASDLMGDDVVELSSENESLKYKIGSYDKNWLGESKAKLLQQIDDEKRTNLFMTGMEKNMKKQN